MQVGGKDKPFILPDGKGEKKRPTALPFHNKPSMSSVWLEHCKAFFKNSLRAELDNGHAFLWWAVAFGAGVAFYFMLPSEPWVLAFPCVAVAFVIVSRRSGNEVSYRLCMACLAISLGISAGSVRTWMVDAPILQAPIEYARVTGRIIQAEQYRTSGQRLIIDVEAIRGLSKEQLPERIRVTINKKVDPLMPGQRLEFGAKLQPPPEPVAPNSADFAFMAFFQKIGATGFVYGAPNMLENNKQGLAERARMSIERLRVQVKLHLQNTMQPDEASVAAALIVGDKSAIPDVVTENLRLSGLAHVLAISGLHMGLVTFTSFAAVLGSLALLPKLALTYNLIKIAALVSWFVAGSYLLISGQSIATIRAFIMVSVVMMALLAGRDGLTMRSVAIAAIITLLLWPEALVGPSFQMSFAAVIALIAAYEALTRWRSRKKAFTYKHDQSFWGLASNRLLLYIGGLAFTSLIAGFATAPVGAFHFHRIAPHSLFGNLAAMPIVGIIVMPSALAGMISIPFGLDAVPFKIMETGLGWVLAIAHYVAHLPEASQNVAQPSMISVILALSGFFWLCFHKERWRLLGILPIILAFICAPMRQSPDIYIARDGKTVALRDAETQTLSVAGLRFGRYDATQWLSAEGDNREIKKAILQDPWACDAYGCIINQKNLYKYDDQVSYKIALSQTYEALNDDCDIADILVTPLIAPVNCTAHFIYDKKFLEKYGATTLTLRLNGRIIENVTYPKRNRPWHNPDKIIDKTGP
jgi:competence protein ComEC